MVQRGCVVVAAIAAVATATAWAADGPVTPGPGAKVASDAQITAPCGREDIDSFGFPGGSPENGDTWLHETKSAQLQADRGARGWVVVGDIVPPACEPVGVGLPGPHRLIQRTHVKREEYQNGWKTVEDEEETKTIDFVVVAGAVPTICIQVEELRTGDGDEIPRSEWGKYGLGKGGIGKEGAIRSGGAPLQVRFRDGSLIRLGAKSTVAAVAGCKEEPENPDGWLRRLELRAGELFGRVSPAAKPGERCLCPQARLGGGDTVISWRTSDAAGGDRAAPRGVLDATGKFIVFYVRVVKDGTRKAMSSTGKLLALGKSGSSMVLKAGEAVSASVGGKLKKIAMSLKPPKFFD